MTVIGVDGDKSVCLQLFSLAAMHQLISAYSALLEGTQPRLMVLALGIFAFTDLTAFHQSVQSLTYSMCYSIFNSLFDSQEQGPEHQRSLAS